LVSLEGPLENRDQEKPFFVYLSHKAVHAGFQPAKRHLGKYDGKKITLPVTYDQTKTGAYRDLGWPEWVHQQRISWHGVDYMYNSNEGFDDMIEAYCETLLGVDESVGAIMEYLEKEGLDEETLVIYMGDNGFSWGEHGLIDKRHFYEESVKVPLIIRVPGQKPLVCDSLVELQDLYPTVARLCGLVPPSYIQGKDISPMLDDPSLEVREAAFSVAPMRKGFLLRDHDYAYIQYLEDASGGIELFDMKTDPKQYTNLAENPAYKTVVEHYKTKMKD